MRVVAALSILIFFAGCQTKSEIRRQQELDRLKAEVKEVRGDKADVEEVNDELRAEVARLASQVEEQAQRNQQQMEEIRKETSTLTTRLQVLEQHAVSEEMAAKKAAEVPPPPPPPKGFEAGRKLFEDGKFEEAIDVLRPIAHGKVKTEESKKAQFLLAESFYATNEFATAALEFSEYRKQHPRDSKVPNAIYRQAQSFKGMGKTKEARLFYQELLEKFPKHSVAAKAKLEMKRLK